MNVLKEINNDNIVKYYDYYKEGNSFFVISEYNENLNLREFIEKHKKENKLIDERVVNLIFLDICKGLKELHKNNLIQKTLKPDMLFISKDYKIQIGHFDFTNNLLKIRYSQNNILESYYNYIAPELLNEELIFYEKTIDMWSLGCILYELLTLNKCFESEENEKTLFNRIKKGEYNKEKIREVCQELKNIINSLFQINENERPNINKLYDSINDLCNKEHIIEKEYYNSLDDISKNILKRNKNIILKEKEINIKNDKNNVNEELLKFNKLFNLNIENSNILKLNLKNKEINNNKLQLLINVNFIELKQLYLSNNKISDIKELLKVKLEKLEILDLSVNEISNIDVLEKLNLIQLKKLNLSGNNISDIKVLEKLKLEKLEILNLSMNELMNIDIIGKVMFKELKELYLAHNKISDIKVL